MFAGFFDRGCVNLEASGQVVAITAELLDSVEPDAIGLFSGVAVVPFVCVFYGDLGEDFGDLPGEEFDLAVSRLLPIG